MALMSYVTRTHAPYTATMLRAKRQVLSDSLLSDLQTHMAGPWTIYFPVKDGATGRETITFLEGRVWQRLL